jgi:hypothetical protein
MRTFFLTDRVTFTGYIISQIVFIIGCGITIRSFPRYPNNNPDYYTIFPGYF